MLPDIQTVKESADLAAIVEDLTGHPGNASGLYHCPICGSGTGPNGTGALSIQGDKWHCFSCHRHGDVFDLAGHLLHTGDFGEKRQQVMEWAGMSDDGDSRRPARPRPAPQRRGPSAQAVERERAYVERCRGAIEAPAALEYLGRRLRVGADEARGLGLGWDPERGRIVIPFPGSDYYHTDRAIGHDGPGKYLKPKGVPQPIWNPAALDGDLVIAVEGPLDALALALSGYGPQTVATCGTAWRAVVDEIRARKWGGTVLVAFDDDEPGARAQADMVAALAGAGVAAAGLAVWHDIGKKDAAEARADDPDALAAALGAAVPEAVERARAELARTSEERFQAGLGTVHVVDSRAAMENVAMLKGASDPVPTGFPSIDRRLGGGLFAGLYVLGATSGMGKTTLLGQVADAVAAGGRGVVFVTLEQSAEEMAAKAMSRAMARRLYGDGRLRDVTAADLMRPAWREGAGPDFPAAMASACDAYLAETGGRVRYVVADSAPSVADIRAVAEHERERLGEPPVVIVDYLQILAAPDERLSDKQVTDRNVSALRRMARDLGTPVIAVSSLNRSSYSGAITYSAFKESGSIEYTCDVLLGLQPRNIADRLDGVADSKAEHEGRAILDEVARDDVKALELTVLKNRWGRPTGYRDGAPLTFHGATSRFVEAAPGRYEE